MITFQNSAMSDAFKKVANRCVAGLFVLELVSVVVEWLVVVVVDRAELVVWV